MARLDSHLWLYDFVSADTDAAVHCIDELVASFQTRFQKVQLMRSAGFGLVLTLDGRVQSLERDEFIYHEALVQPAMTACPEPKDVLVIGGGEGACLREALKHSCVKTVTMVDIDRELVEFCKTHLPTWHQGAFGDPRVRLFYEDAIAWVKNTPDRFDVIIVDLSEPAPDSPSYYLFTAEFYEQLKRLLNTHGTMAIQSDAPALHASDVWSTTTNTARQVFAHTNSYVAMIPGFGSQWGFTLCSMQPLDPLPPHKVDSVLAHRMDPDRLLYYDGLTHQRMFSLPKHLRLILDRETRVFRFDNPPNVQWSSSR